MKKKININREKISSEEIASRRDFDAVLKNYTAGQGTGSGTASKPFYKTVGFAVSSAVVTVAIVAGAWWYASNPGDAHTSESTHSREFNTTTYQPAGKPFERKDEFDASTMPFINPPMKDVNIGYSSYNVNAGKGGEFNYPTGSKIKVPAGAFIDKNGDPVKGNVELRYREFHDPIDFFVSGIPMSYDSAGVKYQFESAGMLEILAFQDGEPVQVNPKKQIEVELSTNNADTKFNLYQLDTAARNWVYKGKPKIKKGEKHPGNDELLAQDAKDTAYSFSDNIIAVNGTSTKVPGDDPKVKKVREEIEEIKKDIAKIEKQKPQEPRKANPSRFKFNIEVDANEFPEIALYKETVFEVGDESKNVFNKDMYKVQWDDATLAEGTKKDINYKLTLTKGTDKHTIIVYPVLTGKNYEVAKKEFDAKFQQYQVTLEKRKVDEAKKQEEYKELVKKMEQERKEQQAKWNAQQQEWAAQQQKRMEEAQRSINYSSVRYAFNISGFGVWNSDSPFRYKDPVRLAASFGNKNGEDYSPQQVFHIDRTNNTLFTHYNGSFNRFEYSPSSDNILFISLPGNKVAIYTEADFAAMPHKPGKYNFMLTVLDKEFKSVAELKDHLLAKK
jgi:hypothetical protein